MRTQCSMALLATMPAYARRYAGDDDNLVDGFEIMLVDAHLIEVDVAVLETSQQGALHGGRILVDLLVHEGVPAAFFGSRGIPIHGVGLRIGHDVAHEVGDDDLVCGHHHRLVWSISMARLV